MPCIVLGAEITTVKQRTDVFSASIELTIQGMKTMSVKSIKTCKISTTATKLHLIPIDALYYKNM